MRLIGLTPVVEFTKISRAAFLCVDSKSAKKTDSLTEFLVLLGSA